MVLQCKKCKDVITSKRRHDMVWCKCGAIAIDGGSDYTKITCNKEDVEALVPESKLKQQLEEKEKIINNLLNETQDLKKVLQIVSDKLINEDKISFAVEQLEKVKEFYVHNIKWTAHENMSMLEFINNQIKRLKEDKGE